MLESKKKFARILVAVDASKQSEWAAQIAAALAQATGGTVALIHVYCADSAKPGYSPQMGRPVEEILDQLKRQGQGILQRHRCLLPADVAVKEVLLEGDAAAQIARAAKLWRADLVFTGSHGRGRLGQFLIGSTADAVIRRSPCPVLCVAHQPPPIVVDAPVRAGKAVVEEAVGGGCAKAALVETACP